ncbi:hypothetical protein HB815_03300 [Listeria booriae]|uniref:hypothetical protein n=1 Tax=Listeria booriae TaxID=1552123 RepID=UPI001624C1A3|nr:hypothetical protein [Listeria booriae]MBC1209947.1 hypothetical protein [Listeria booriae]
MKKQHYIFIFCMILIVGWEIFSLNQPAIIVGKSRDWKVVYEPRKGDVADSEEYPWSGKVIWRHLIGEPEIVSVDLLIEGKYINDVDADATKKGNGNFDGKVLDDPETFYNGPDKTIQGMRIIWKKDGTSHTDEIIFERKKRLFVKPLF